MTYKKIKSNSTASRRNHDTGFMYTAVLSKELDELCPDAFLWRVQKICGSHPTSSYNPEQPAQIHLIGMLQSYPSWLHP